MSEQPTRAADQGKRRAGRPRGEQPPMTTAERMRAMRDRARQAAIFETDWASASDTRLTEAAGHLMRAGRPALLAGVAVEMMARANARRLDVAGAVELDWRVVDPSRSSEPSEPVEAVESSASNPSKPMVSVTVTNSEPVDQGELFALPSILFAMPVESTRASEPVEAVESKPCQSSASKGKGSQWADLVESVAPSASTQTKAKAVAILMKRDTALHADIIDVLKAGGVTCPPSMPSNLGRSYLPKYATESDVAEILAKLETEHCKTQ